MVYVRANMNNHIKVEPSKKIIKSINKDAEQSMEELRKIHPYLKVDTKLQNIDDNGELTLQFHNFAAKFGSKLDIPMANEVVGMNYMIELDERMIDIVGIINSVEDKEYVLKILNSFCSKCGMLKKNCNCVSAKKEKTEVKK